MDNNSIVVVLSPYPCVEIGDMGVVIEYGAYVSKVLFANKHITQKILTWHLSEIGQATVRKFSFKAWFTSMTLAFGQDYALDLAPEYAKYDGLTADKIPVRLPAEWFR